MCSRGEEGSCYIKNMENGFWVLPAECVMSLLIWDQGTRGIWVRCQNLQTETGRYVTRRCGEASHSYASQTPAALDYHACVF